MVGQTKGDKKIAPVRLLTRERPTNEKKPRKRHMQEYIHKSKLIFDTYDLCECDQASCTCPKHFARQCVLLGWFIPHQWIKDGVLTL